MIRIYHRFELWECFKNGLYENKSGLNKEECILKVIDFFSQQIVTEIYMKKVISEWHYSCEHNLSNLSLNRIAWLGQSACCLYAKIPYNITMEAWSHVEKGNQKKADSIALSIIEKYEKRFTNV